MSSETAPNQAEKQNPPEDPSRLDPEVLDKIKHPPSIHDQMKQLSPEELRANQAVSPEMLNSGEDLRDDIMPTDEAEES
ncbi:hypothetical protein B7486_40870 [cyanobacterium TDX16]|nr:hypothetical protein B7486_40870 [cyanobacterium TDX16]